MAIINGWALCPYTHGLYLRLSLVILCCNSLYGASHDFYFFVSSCTYFSNETSLSTMAVDVPWNLVIKLSNSIMVLWRGWHYIPKNRYIHKNCDPRCMCDNIWRKAHGMSLIIHEMSDQSRRKKRNLSFMTRKWRRKCNITSAFVTRIWLFQNNHIFYTDANVNGPNFVVVTLEVLRDVARSHRPFVNSSISGQNGRHFADVDFRWILVNEKFYTLIKKSLKFVPKGQIDNKPAF